MESKKFNLHKISRQLKNPWTPIDIAQVDDSILRIAKFKGSYHWHEHNKDELFIVLEGKIKIQTRKKKFILIKNEGIIIKKNIEHYPVAIKSSIVLMFENSKLKTAKANLQP